MVEKVKKAIAPFYTDKCTVYEKRAVNVNGRTRFEQIVKYENIPCRISSKAYLFGENAASESNNMLKLSKKTRLFLPTEYTIDPGSIIEVTTRGHKKAFAKSGDMSFYDTHNEVMVELLKNYA